MLKFIRFYFKNFLIEVLLLGFAATILLVLVLIALSPDNTILMAMEMKGMLLYEALRYKLIRR